MLQRLPPRRSVHRFGLIIGTLFLLSVLDTFVSGHLEDPRTIRALPDTRHAVNGTLDVTVDGISQLTYRGDVPGIVLTFLDLRGRIWRGELRVALPVQSGDYRIRILNRQQPSVDAAPALRVLVFETPGALNASYPSICRKVLGISPWWVVVITFPPLVCALLLAYLHSSQRESDLERQGIYPIVKLARRKDHWEVGIGLHGEQKLFAGDLLRLLNTQLEPVGELRIRSVKGGLASAELDLSVEIAPAYYVQKSYGPSFPGSSV